VLPDKESLSNYAEKFPEWKLLEEYLGTNVFNIPIYFTWDNEEATSVYNELLNSELETDDNQLQFVVNADEKFNLRKITLDNYHGFIYDYEESLPIIALVTHYDSFSILPDDTVGMDENGSGVIAMMELAKTFHKLY
jgi:hypothetical protein